MHFTWLNNNNNTNTGSNIEIILKLTKAIWCYYQQLLLFEYPFSKNSATDMKTTKIEIKYRFSDCVDVDGSPVFIEAYK